MHWRFNSDANYSRAIVWTCATAGHLYILVHTRFVDVADLKISFPSWETPRDLSLLLAIGYIERPAMRPIVYTRMPARARANRMRNRLNYRVIAILMFTVPRPPLINNHGRDRTELTRFNAFRWISLESFFLEYLWPSTFILISATLSFSLCGRAM